MNTATLEKPTETKDPLIDAARVELRRWDQLWIEYDAFVLKRRQEGNKNYGQQATA